MQTGNTKANGWTFAQIPIWVICDPDLSHPAKTLLGYLKYRQGTDAACWPSKTSIAEDLHCSTDTVTRRLNELIKHGYVKRIERPGRSNLYHLIADPGGKQEAWQQREEARRAKRAPTSKDDPPAKMREGEDTSPQKCRRVPPAKMQGGPPRKNAPHDDSQGTDNHRTNNHDELTSQQQMFGRVAELTQIDLATITDKNRAIIGQVASTLLKAGATVDEMKDFETYWYSQDWRGQKNQAPDPWDIVNERGRMLHWRKGRSNRNTTKNGKREIPSTNGGVNERNQGQRQQTENDRKATYRQRYGKLIEEATKR